MRQLNCFPSVRIISAVFSIEYGCDVIPVFTQHKYRFKLKDDPGRDNKRDCLVVEKDSPHPKGRFVFVVKSFTFEQEFLFANLHAGSYEQAAEC